MESSKKALEVGAYTSWNPVVTLSLKAPGFNPFENLKCDILVSQNLLFQIHNLCRYIEVENRTLRQLADGSQDEADDLLRAKEALEANAEARVGTFRVIQSRTRVMGWHFSRYSVQNSGYGLALFTLFSPELGLWVGTFHVIQSRTRVMGWRFSHYSVQNSGYGLALFTLFSPELGLWVGAFHVIQSRTRVMGWRFSRYSVQNSGYGLALFTLFSPELGLWVGAFHAVNYCASKHTQLMTPRTMVHVSNLTPGSECNPLRLALFTPLCCGQITFN
jgi:hypothetical protein